MAAAWSVDVTVASIVWPHFTASRSAASTHGSCLVSRRHGGFDRMATFYSLAVRCFDTWQLPGQSTSRWLRSYGHILQPRGPLLRHMAAAWSVDVTVASIVWPHFTA